MVSIVMVLSAAIGTFVLGLGGGLAGDSTAAVDIIDIQTGGNGSVTVSVTTLYYADHIDVTANVNSGGNITHDGDIGTGIETRLESTGASATFAESTGNTNKTTIHLLAISVDGDREQVVMDREETI